ncbi:MAG: tRNA lysidine(34) synthetase TilS [Oscillospiraceae bacterium]|nr:tRNA lysidine(34) synthetase TilS [Oscillospiraceae bacterium]
MLPEKVFNTLSQHNMISAGDTVAVCLSGGADSMALFHFFCRAKEKLGINLIALHVNHGLRAESRQEEKFVQAYCASEAVDCIITRLDMNNNEKPQGLSTESWARDLRYKFFFEQAEKNSAKLATAHTLSDRAETVLFNLTRGTSLKGAAGIPAVRDNIVRPLIDCTREDVEKYCADNGIPYVNDRTNFQDIYSRNKIRLNVLPQLKAINPQAEKAIAAFAEDSREIYTLLTQLSDNLYKKALGLGGLDVNILLSEHPAVVKNMLRNRLDKLDCLSKDNVEAIYAALPLQSFKRQLSATVYCRVKDGRLSFYTPKEKTGPVQPPVMDVCFDTMLAFTHHNLLFSVIPYEEYKRIQENNKNHLTYAINYDIIKGVVSLRTRKTGDSFTFANRNVTKSLKKLFIEDKIPRGFRDRIAILTDETDAVIWLADYGVNKAYIPDSNTKNILLIT